MYIYLFVYVTLQHIYIYIYSVICISLIYLLRQYIIYMVINVFYVIITFNRVCFLNIIN